jgi:predicted TIM-barrel fold metal-dependent hydrolase
MTKMYHMSEATSKIQVDCHFHVFEAGQAIVGARYTPSYDSLLSDWQARATSLGITHGVLVQPSFLGVDNRFLLANLLADPHRLRGVAVVSPSIRPEELRVLHTMGIRGLRLNLSGVSHDLSDWQGRASLWDSLLEMGWHIEIHTDRGALPGVIASLPSSLHLVIDHMAKPGRADLDDPTIKLLERLTAKRVTIKPSGAYRLHGVDAASLVSSFYQVLGPAALIWGSDWPCTNFEHYANYSDLLSALEAWLPENCLDEILTTNPMRLYWQ